MYNQLQEAFTAYKKLEIATSMARFARDQLVEPQPREPIGSQEEYDAFENLLAQRFAEIEEAADKYREKFRLLEESRIYLMNSIPMWDVTFRVWYLEVPFLISKRYDEDEEKEIMQIHWETEEPTYDHLPDVRG